MDSKTRNRVLKIARSWINTPWHHQARLKGIGVDCAMYLCDVFNEAELIPFIDPRPYPRDWHFHRDDERFLEILGQFADEVVEPSPGDVAVFKFGRTYSHGSIVIEWPRVIHAYVGDVVREQDSNQGYLKDREFKFYRVR